MAYIKKLKDNELIGGTDNTDVYPVTSTEAVYNKENVSQEYINNHVDGSKIVDGTVTNSKIANGAVSMNKLDNETQTLIQRGADSSWTPMGDYDVDALYYANDLVFDPETNSSYLSLRADNMGHAVTDETWWMKVLDGSYVNRAIEEMEAAIAQAIEDAQEDIDDAIAGANEAAQNANEKVAWMEGQVDSLTAYEVATALDETSIIPVQNKVVTEELGKVNNYLQDGIRTLVVGQTYNLDEAVKTSDSVLVRMTKEIKAINTTDAVAKGDLRVANSQTWKSLKVIAEYDEDGNYSSGDYAIIDGVVEKYDGNDWSEVTIADMYEDTNLYTEITIETLTSDYTIQNSLLKDLVYPNTGYTFNVNDRVTIAKSGYCLVDGVETAQSGGRITNPISLKKGDKITLTSIPRPGSGRKDIDAIAYIGKDGKYHRLMTASTGSITSVSYVLQENYDVVFSSDAAMNIGSNSPKIDVYRPPVNDPTFYQYKRYYNDWLTGNGFESGYTPVVGSVFAMDKAYQVNKRDQPRQLIPCNENDVFVISVTGYPNTNNTVWWITDENYKVIMANGSSSLKYAYQNYEIRIPSGGKYLMLNGNSSYTRSVYKKVATEEETYLGFDMSLLMYTNSSIGNNTFKAKVIPAVGSKLNSNQISGNYLFKMIPVMEGEQYNLSAVLSDTTFSGYVILDSNYICIQRVETSLKEWANHINVTIPQGGCWLLFNVECNTTSSTNPTNPCWVRRTKEAESIVEAHKDKEPILANMSRYKTWSGSGGTLKATYNNRLTFAWITDNHCDITRYKRFIEFVNAYKGNITAVLNTGDNNRTSDYDKGWNKTVKTYIPEVPLLPVLGNHDCFGYYNGNKDVLNSGSRQWNGEQYIVPVADTNCVFDEGGTPCYYYRDFANEKIRVIVINDYDKPRIANGTYWQTTTDPNEIASAVDWVSGTTYEVGAIIKYKGLYIKCKSSAAIDDNGSKNAGSNDARVLSSTPCEYRYIDQAQLTFIANAMLNTPSGYSIVFASHMALEAPTAQTVFANEAWESYNNMPQNSSLPNYNPIGVGFGQDANALKDLISAYLNKTTLTKTYHSVSSGYDDVSIDVDFSSVSGDILCFLNGHQHTDSCFYVMCGEKKLLNIGLTTNCFTDNYWDLTGSTPSVWTVDDTIRDCVSGRDCFNIISFDVNEKAIYILRIGANINDRFVERDYVRLSCAHV